MNLLDKGDVLERGYNNIDYNVFKPSEWTVCLAKYLYTIFPEIKLIADEFTRDTDFYKKSPIIAQFINSLKIIDSNENFKLDSVNRGLYINQSDIKEFKRKQILKEIFYSIKLGAIAYENVPSSLVYYLKECFDDENIPDTYSVNLLPKTEFEELSSGQLGDPIDIIGKIRGANIEILSNTKKYILTPKNIEFYISSSDNVAVAPKALIEFIPIYKLDEIVINKGVLCIDRKPLHLLLGKQGFYKRSIYDLVNCI